MLDLLVLALMVAVPVVCTVVGALGVFRWWSEFRVRRAWARFEAARLVVAARREVASGG